jgi:hypothetical protein
MTLGGARCADTEMCIRVPQKNATSPNGTETGFACCPKSRYQIKTVSTAEEWKVYTLQETGTDLAADPPFVNYTCAVQNGETYDEAKAPTNPMELTLPAKLAESGVRASGCSVNFTAFPDRTVDDCLLKTCRPVCLDVNRRCPRELGFECPPLDDWREYDDNTCNMLVPHGPAPPPAPSLPPPARPRPAPAHHASCPTAPPHARRPLRRAADGAARPQGACCRCGPASRRSAAGSSTPRGTARRTTRTASPSRPG